MGWNLLENGRRTKRPAQDPGDNPQRLFKFPSLALSASGRVLVSRSRNLDPRRACATLTANSRGAPHVDDSPLQSLDACGSGSRWRLAASARSPALRHHSAATTSTSSTPATNKVVAGDRGDETPQASTFAPRHRVYVSNEADSTLDVVDRKTGRIVKKVP